MGHGRGLPVGPGFTAPHAPPKRGDARAVAIDAQRRPDAATDIVSSAQAARPKSLSNIQTLYAIGGVLETSSIIIGAQGAASAIRFRGKFEEAAFIENARRLKIAAKDAKLRGRKDVSNFMDRVKRLQGSQEAALAAQGIEISSGTAAAIIQETVELGIEDVSTIRTNAIREAFGFKIRAIELEAQARQTRIARKFNEKQARLLGISKAAQSATGTAINISRAGSA